MIKQLILAIKDARFRVLHAKVEAQLIKLEWDKEKAYENAKRNFVAINKAWSSADPNAMKTHATELFIQEYQSNPSLFLHKERMQKIADVNILKFYVVDVALNAVKLEKGVCLCNDDLSGKLSVAINAQFVDESDNLLTMKAFELWEFVWEAKQWKCNSISQG